MSGVAIGVGPVRTGYFIYLTKKRNWTNGTKERPGTFIFLSQTSFKNEIKVSKTKKNKKSKDTVLGDGGLLLKP